MATVSERLALIIDTIGAGRAIGDIKGLARATAGLEGDLKKMRVGGLSTADMLKTGIAVGATAAGAALVGLAAKGVASFVELGQKTLDLQRRTGATAEAASGLVSAMSGVGISSDQAASALFKLARGIAGAELEKFGVTVARTATGGVDLQETLLGIADAYTGTTDPARRAQLLVAAFGKSGADLIPILERGRAGIADLFAEAARTGQIMNQEDVNRAENFRLAMEGLHVAVERLERGVGGALVPALTDLANSLANAIDRAGELAERLSNITPGFIKSLNNLRNKASGFFDMIYDPAAYAARQLGDDVEDTGYKFEGFAGGIGDAAAAAAAADKNFDALRDSIFGVVNAERAQAQAAQGVTTASERLSDARKKVNDLMRAGAVDTKEVAAAQKNLEDATKGVTRAQRDLVDAQAELVDLNTQLQELLGTGKRVDAQGRAIDRLDKATVGAARAGDRYSDAQAILLQLQMSGTATAEELEDAELDVAEASLANRDAARELAEAQKAVNEAQKIGTEQDPAVITLRGQIKDKTQDVADATDNVATAQGRALDARNTLHEAEKGDPEFAGNLAAARRGVRDAERELSGARYTLAERTWNVVDATEKEKEAFGLAAGEADKLRTKLEELKRAHPELAPFLAPALANLANMIGAGLSIGLGPAGGGGGLGAGRGGPALKTFQHGGVVPGSGPRLAVVHGGERIIPGGGGGATINITVNGAFDPRAVAGQIRDMLVALQRRSGNLGIEAA
jgi:hypothetical protein